MTSNSYSSYEKSIRDNRKNPALKTLFKRRRSITTESSDSESSSPSRSRSGTEEVTNNDQTMTYRKSPKEKANYTRGRKRFRRVAPNPVSGKRHEKSTSPSSKQTSYEEATSIKKETSRSRGRKVFRRQAPNPAGGKSNEKKVKEKLVSASQNRQPVLKNDVTREDVTKEIMEKYHVESKKGWKQRVEEWLGSQPDIAVSGNVKESEEEIVSKGNQEKREMKGQSSGKLVKKSKSYKTPKTPTSSGVQGRKRKHNSSSKNKTNQEKSAEEGKSQKGDEKKKRKKEGPNPSAAIDYYGMASGERTSGDSEQREKTKQERREMLQKKRKLMKVIMKSKSPGWSVLKAISLIEAKGKQATPKLIHYVIEKKFKRPFITRKNVEDLLKIMLQKNIINSEKVKETIAFSSKVKFLQQKF